MESRNLESTTTPLSKGWTQRYARKHNKQGVESANQGRGLAKILIKQIDKPKEIRNEQSKVLL